jgi:hypothetical protein
VQLPLQPSGRWSILALDMREALASQQHSYASLRSVQFCANQLVRGLFTSDLKLSLQVRRAAALGKPAALVCRHRRRRRRRPGASSPAGATPPTSPPPPCPPLQSLPKELIISQAMDTSQFDMVWLPAEPSGLQEPTISR